MGTIHLVMQLLEEGLRLQLMGVGLKEEEPGTVLGNLEVDE